MKTAALCLGIPFVADWNETYIGVSPDLRGLTITLNKRITLSSMELIVNSDKMTKYKLWVKLLSLHHIIQPKYRVEHAQLLLAQGVDPLDIRSALKCINNL